ncbi:DNA primase [Methylophaga frappieri]|uniref:DNA primase n=1 Tax=Methylophaga frappieri (strain ATCC BAA-2434 / DSM 25690 / JAM7) TaxID=754477 RepID=I1YJR8_METFJ|nr:DNA primase [Methylophaga frappieri]AFJ03161.1 DNA primase [Methylophaga frappieri]
MAGKIPPQFIDALLARVDIVDVIDARVPLKKAGKNLQACCPFHNEKTPSFTVSPEKQFYHCFGCGAHGTAISFLMEYDQLSFPEAIQELAESVGMQVPAAQQNALRPVQQNLYDLLEKANQYYLHQLQHHPQRQVFLDYLEQRGLSTEIVHQFDIGMAPDGWDNLFRTLASNNETSRLLEQAGMLVKNDKGRLYDRFRNRLMFPIRDRRGRVIGFGGRVIEADALPKYLNSPETPIFRKGHELYGLYQARKANRRLDRILIVEGYMDVIALAQYGVTNAVATLGTATTPDHLRQLIRSAPEVVFCFDGDQAGLDAAWRAAENALPVLGGNFELKFMFLPAGDDPDSLIRREGKAQFETMLNDAQSFSAFFLDHLKQRVGGDSMDARARLIELAKPYLGRITAGVYRDMLAQQLAEQAQTSRHVLNKHLGKSAESNRPAKKKTPTVSQKTPERLAISILLQYPTLHLALTETESLANLSNKGVVVLRQLLEMLRNNPQLTNSGMLLERWRGHELFPHLEKLAKMPLDFDETDKLRPELVGCIQKLQQQARYERQKYLTEKYKSPAGLTSSEKEELRSLM